jgi:hypothetical protein
MVELHIGSIAFGIFVGAVIGGSLGLYLGRLLGESRLISSSPQAASKPPATSPDAVPAPPAASSASDVVRSRMLRSNGFRLVRLTARRGPMVMCESCDDGEESIGLIQEHHVHPEDRPKFRAWLSGPI